MALSEPAAEAAIGAACRVLHLPTVRAEAGPLADAAAKERVTHRAYLAEVLSAEVDQRDGRRRARRLHRSPLPRLKRLEDFDLAAAPNVNPATLAALAKGAWIDAGEPVVLIGDSGTGKSHLLIGLGVAACEAGRRVRYVTCAQLVNELAEAADERILSKVVGRYGRLDLLLVDELGYVSVDPRGAELLFQVLTEREERASVADGQQPSLQRMGPNLHRPPPRRRRGGPLDLPRPHHRDRHRQLPSANRPSQKEQSKEPTEEPAMSPASVTDRRSARIKPRLITPP